MEERTHAGEWRCGCGTTNAATRPHCMACGSPHGGDVHPAPSASAPDPAGLPHPAHPAPPAARREPTFGPPPEDVVAPLIAKPTPGKLPSPLEPGGLIMCGFTAFALVGIIFAGPLAALVGLGLLGWFYAYLVLVFRSVVAGHDELADSPSLDEARGMLLRYLALSASVFLVPALLWIAANVRGTVDHPDALLSILALGALAVGGFLLPMAFMATSVIDESRYAFHYPILIRAIVKTAGPYAKLVAMSLGALAIPVVADAVLDRFAADGGFVATGVTQVLSWSVSFWIELVLAVQAGKFYRENKTTIGWFEGG